MIRGTGVPPAQVAGEVGNPKDAIGSRKLPFSVVPTTVIAQMALGMGEGDWKYGGHNYRAAKVRASIYYEACLGHLMSWFEGEDIDPESQILHLTKMLTSGAVILDAILNDSWIDDRPIRAKPGTFGRAAELNKQYQDMIAALGPRRAARYTAKPVRFTEATQTAVTLNNADKS